MLTGRIEPKRSKEDDRAKRRELLEWKSHGEKYRKKGSENQRPIFQTTA